MAFDLLRAVGEKDAYANLTLPGLLTAARLPERDRALAAELGYGTLRWQGTLDHVLAQCVTRPLTDVEPAVLEVLRLGAYQLLRMRVPTHAAVSTSVELARNAVGERAAGFTNAVMRKVAARDGDLGAPDYAIDPIGHLAVTHAHPEWVVAAFADALSGDLAETAVALAADDRPSVHLVARDIDRDALIAECAEIGLHGEAGPWSPYAVRLAGGDPATLPSVRHHRAGVQDEGSQLAALTLARLLPRGPARVLDMCAGPGGKAALLSRVLPAGSRIVANDVHGHRAGLTRGALTGAPVPAATVHADALVPAWPTGAFDGVLLDAPCSGLGALRRRPESRWRRQPRDVERLAVLQRDLLARALEAVRPGGVVVYVVCSPHLTEGRDVVERAAGELIDVRPVLEPLADVGPGPWVQMWTHRQGTDAMFVAAIHSPL